MGGFGGGVEAEAVNFIVDKINVIGIGIPGPLNVYFVSHSFGILFSIVSRKLKLVLPGIST